MGLFKIVYRDAAGHDRKAFTTFEDNVTIEENLANIVPKAKEKGLLHPEATAQNVIVEYNGARLNTKLPINQAAPGIKEHDNIIIRYLASQINFCMHIIADDPADQRRIFFGRRRTLRIKETVAVSPSEPLIGQIGEKLEEVRGKHKFYGKEIKDVRQLRLRTPDKRIQPVMSLAEQGIEADLEVDVKPRVWFDWPPCFYYGFKGPYTGHAITLGIAAIVVVLIVLLSGATDIPRFQVTFEAPIECNIKIDDSTSAFIPVEKGKPTAGIEAGRHAVYVYPRELPIQKHDMLLEKRVRGGVGESDSMWTEQLTLALPDTTATDTVVVDTTSVRIVGYLGEGGYENLQVPLLFNGFEYPPPEELSWHFNLIPGEYEFKFKLGDDRLISSNPVGEGVRKQSDFIFAVEDTLETSIEFRYGKEGDS